MRREGFGARWRDLARAGALAVVALGLLGGCLVTNKIEYDETNYPPYVMPISPDNFTRVPGTPDKRACGDYPMPDDNTPWMAFIVNVSDPNIEDDLEARLVVNGSRADDKVVPRTGRIDRAPLVLCAKLRDLTANCNRVEVVVTSHFSFQGAPYATQIPDDRGYWRWWVLANAGESPKAQPSDCTEQLQDGGLP
jgi:hypothetical protein